MFCTPSLEDVLAIFACRYSGQFRLQIFLETSWHGEALAIFAWRCSLHPHSETFKPTSLEDVFFASLLEEVFCILAWRCFFASLLGDVFCILAWRCFFASLLGRCSVHFRLETFYTSSLREVLPSNREAEKSLMTDKSVSSGPISG